MKLMLRPEDRTDREMRQKALRSPVFSSGGIRAAASRQAETRQAETRQAAPRAEVAEPRAECAAPQQDAMMHMPAVAWRVPGYVRPTRLSRPEWLIRGFELLARSGHSALQLAVLCDCPGGSRAGFFGCFSDMAVFRSEMLALWESAAATSLADGKGPAISCLLELADEAAAPCQADTAGPAAAGTDEPDGIAIERAIRDWARSDIMVAAALARVDAWRLAELQQLLVCAGLSHRRAAERAAVFYAARLGFDRLRETTDVMAAAPMRALALAILGAKLPPPDKGGTMVAAG